MPYPRLKVADREIIALVPVDCGDGQERRHEGALPEMHHLLQVVQDTVDAVAFAFVEGRWFPAA